jgi:hypothetical protein
MPRKLKTLKMNSLTTDHPEPMLQGICLKELNSLYLFHIRFQLNSVQSLAIAYGPRQMINMRKVYKFRNLYKLYKICYMVSICAMLLLIPAVLLNLIQVNTYFKLMMLFAAIFCPLLLKNKSK